MIMQTVWITPMLLWSQLSNFTQHICVRGFNAKDLLLSKITSNLRNKSIKAWCLEMPATAIWNG
jgi:hypothetical protein